MRGVLDRMISANLIVCAAVCWTKIEIFEARRIRLNAKRDADESARGRSSLGARRTCYPSFDRAVSKTLSLNNSDHLSVRLLGGFGELNRCAAAILHLAGNAILDGQFSDAWR